MGMSAAGGGSNAKPNINVTPLIDVLLVLIIIFMVVKHSDPHKLDSDVPEKTPENLTAQPPSRLFFIECDENGKNIKLNTLPMNTPEELASRLKSELKNRLPDDRNVFISAPRNTKYEYVANLVDIVRGAEPDPQNKTVRVGLDHENKK
ncbi:MAG TPA: biopolymer transporter ExbD [Acidobacteriota bacterium]|nr:biopolymer transporter ExbD [Acidobacteriota bacterium]HMZ79056.1 biopolymer transporter ExbD [Acidobacteriota bacterium]HNB69770.1 biopolymer transporter ExbD [Acidobacteriota bacterium]